MNKKFKLLFFLFVIFKISVAQETPKHLLDLYNSIYKSMASISITKPKLLLVDDLSDASSEKIVAVYSPSERTIKIGKSFLALTQKFGLDSNNARAHVISHELAHLFLNHGYAHIIGTGFASSLINKELKKTKVDIESKMGEIEADQWAFFYAHIAGYKTNLIAPILLDSIYSYYKLTDQKLSKYPPLSERKSYAKQAAVKMESMQQAFDFSTMCLVHGDYEMAIEIYNAILDEGFKSREIISNLGTAHLLKSIQLLDSTQLKYVLPIQLDANTRLSQNNVRGIVDKNEVIENLNRAAELYQIAISIDADYGYAYLNLSMVNWLLKKNDDANFYLRKVKREGYLKNKAELLEALFNIESSDLIAQNKGKEMLKSLMNKDYHLAKLNYAIIENKNSFKSKVTIPEFINEYKNKKLLSDFLDAHNLLDSTFKKDQSKTLSCKEVNSTITARKWKSLKENTLIVYQYIFTEQTQLPNSVDKSILLASCEVMYETSIGIFVKFEDVILLIKPDNSIRIQILKSL